MTYPSPGSMQLLFAIYDGHAMELRENPADPTVSDLWLCVPPDESRVFEAHFDIPATENAVPTYVVPEEATTPLFDREWIEWDDAHGKPKITDAGKYHLEKWVRVFLIEQETRNSRKRWLRTATLPMIQAHYRIKTPEEWNRTTEPITTETP